MLIILFLFFFVPAYAHTTSTRAIPCNVCILQWNGTFFATLDSKTGAKGRRYRAVRRVCVDHACLPPSQALRDCRRLSLPNFKFSFMVSLSEYIVVGDLPLSNSLLLAFLPLLGSFTSVFPFVVSFVDQRRLFPSDLKRSGTIFSFLRLYIYT